MSKSSPRYRRNRHITFYLERQLPPKKIFSEGISQGPQKVRPKTQKAERKQKEEKRKRAKKFRDDYGCCYGEIAKDLRVGKTSVCRRLNEENEKVNCVENGLNKGSGTYSKLISNFAP